MFGRLFPYVFRVAVIVAPPALLVGVLFASVLFTSPTLLAAPKAKAPAKKAPAKPAKADAGGEVSPKESPKEIGLEKDGGPKAEPGELVKESEKKEGDAAVKVFEFGTTEIEGRARWPAVTYFVRRMRAEFEAQKLPHRPFLPELEATKGDPAVK